MISANLRGYGRAKLLLDSGAAELVLLQWAGLSGLGDTRVTTVNGSMICESANTILHLGKGEVREIRMMSCQGQTVKPKGTDGTLPTAIFKQIFISHAGSYAIINPVQVRREIAVIAKLSQ
jgi:hypothetical protein